MYLWLRALRLLFLVQLVALALPGLSFLGGPALTLEAALHGHRKGAHQ